jgi:hypothetical protein
MSASFARASARRAKHEAQRGRGSPHDRRFPFTSAQAAIWGFATEDEARQHFVAASAVVETARTFTQSIEAASAALTAADAHVEREERKRFAFDPRRMATFITFASRDEVAALDYVEVRAFVQKFGRGRVFLLAATGAGDALEWLYVPRTRALAILTAPERRAFVEAVGAHSDAARIAAMMARRVFRDALLAMRARDVAATAGAAHV